MTTVSSWMFIADGTRDWVGWCQDFGCKKMSVAHGSRVWVVWYHDFGVKKSKVVQCGSNFDRDDWSTDSYATTVAMSLLMYVTVLTLVATSSGQRKKQPITSAEDWCQNAWNYLFRNCGSGGVIQVIDQYLKHWNIVRQWIGIQTLDRSIP